jgi:hypothetical protein
MPVQYEGNPSEHFKTLRQSARLAALIAVLVLVSTGQALTKTAASNADVKQGPPAPVAHVYIGTASGIELYDAASNGKLTLVPGSPFQTSGEMIGSNGKFFITLGTNDVHAYPVAANGAIKEQVSFINTADYDGADCGTPYGTAGAVLDHTGQNVYVLLDYATIFSTGEAGKYNMLNTGVCIAYQTYDIGKTSGALTFNGAAVSPNGDFGGCCTVPAITGHDTFGYATASPGPFWVGSFIGLSRKSDGTLKNLSFNETDPTPSPTDVWYPMAAAADPDNHLAVALESYKYSTETTVPMQLASYTINGSGDIASTNTREEMPTLEGHVDAQDFPVYPMMNMSPSGKLLAVAGKPYGLQIFHFDGAEPIKAYSGVLTTANISQIHWDNNNHLYALSESTGKLYVYTITPTSISEVSGSPYKIASPNGLVVVPIS